MKPDIEHVKPLERFDSIEFARWLRSGFHDLLHQDKRLTAFAPLNYFVRRHGRLSDELKNIYDKLSGPSQDHFRIGLAIAFSELPKAYEVIPLARGLLHLAGRIQAPEILPYVIQQVGNGFFGLPQYQDEHELFALTLDIVAGMSPAYLTGDTLRRLVTSSFFRPEYAPRAFIALCRAEPTDFPSHLKLLQQNFTTLHCQKGTGNTFFTAKRFVQYVDLKIISEKLLYTYLSTKLGVDPIETDNWMGDSLFIGKNAPLLLLNEDDDFIIRRRNSENNHISMVVNTELNDLEWDHVFYFVKYLNKCIEQNRDQMWTDTVQQIPEEKLKLYIHALFPYGSEEFNNALNNNVLLTKNIQSAFTEISSPLISPTCFSQNQPLKRQVEVHP